LEKGLTIILHTLTFILFKVSTCKACVEDFIDYWRPAPASHGCNGVT
jgi:hypothetical protein